MTEPVVMAAHPWPDNSYLLRDVAALGHIKTTDLILDPTFGRGVWWKRWKADRMVKHDLHKLDGVDFRDLPEVDDTFDVVAFDPPYVAPGGRKTTKMPEFADRYGMHSTPATPEDNQQMICDGMTECVRVLKPGGVLLIKCQSYVSSGKFFNGVYLTKKHAIETLGLVQIDELQHMGKPRAQPARKRKDGQKVRQHHARNNYSTLMVFKKPKP